MTTPLSYVTAKGTIMYPRLTEPRAFEGKKTGDKKFNVSLVIDNDDLGKFQSLVKDEASGEVNPEPANFTKLVKGWVKDHWKGAKKVKDLDNAPSRTGAEYNAGRVDKKKKPFDFLKDDSVILNFSTLEQNPPAIQVLNADGSIRQLDILVDKEEIEKLFYSGARALVMSRANPYDGRLGTGVSYFLNRIILVGSGTRLELGGGTAFSEKIAGLAGGSEDYDPTNSDDEIE